MAWRAIAAVSVCLFTAGAAPAIPAAASAVPATALPAVVRSAVNGQAAMPTAAVRSAVTGSPGCDTVARRVTSGRGPEPHAPAPAQVAEMFADLRRRQSGMRRGPWAPITVPTWVHVISAGPLGARDSAVRDQLAALNAAYGGRLGGVDTGIQFRLDGLTRTENAAWFRAPLAYEAAIKRLRRGGAGTLNLYVAQLSQLVLGYSTYPYLYKSQPALDGVVIDWRSLPGGSLRNFDRGFTGVHEIGHWLGLLHTFENGCVSPGDGVADTAPESKPTEGCPVSKDTCNGEGGDPVHNFMDYTHDHCMSEFTAGQAARMHEMWAVYRGSEPDLTLDG
ncbi:zinc metalloprotease [Streptosporangium sp. NBC_01639]|uniref:zinc metalloprotease n=1 Tax=Streptosporangium sp. NBC_01639 TaxID=2975948 RepID=UPI00386EED1C|nr:zinc metalloprotease [Streptosporangium sp. NBC_01639]